MDFSAILEQLGPMLMKMKGGLDASKAAGATEATKGAIGTLPQDGPFKMAAGNGTSILGKTEQVGISTPDMANKPGLNFLNSMTPQQQGSFLGNAGMMPKQKSAVEEGQDLQGKVGKQALKMAANVALPGVGGMIVEAGDKLIKMKTAGDLKSQASMEARAMEGSGYGSFKDGGKTVPTYQPKSKEDELYRKQAYKDSLDLYKYNQLKHKLEPERNPNTLKNFAVGNLIDTSVNDKILREQATKLIKNNPNLKPGFMTKKGTVLKQNFETKKTSPDIYHDEIKPISTWWGTALNNNYAPPTQPVGNYVEPIKKVIPKVEAKPKKDFDKIYEESIKKRGGQHVSFKDGGNTGSIKIDETRFEMNKSGIYDARKDKFTKEHFKKFIESKKQNEGFKELNKFYGEDKIIDMMNGIVQNKKQNIKSNLV